MAVVPVQQSMRVFRGPDRVHPLAWWLRSPAWWPICERTAADCGQWTLACDAQYRSGVLDATPDARTAVQNVIRHDRSWKNNCEIIRLTLCILRTRYICPEFIWHLRRSLADAVNSPNISQELNFMPFQKHVTAGFLEHFTKIKINGKYVQWNLLIFVNLYYTFFVG